MQRMVELPLFRGTFIYDTVERVLNKWVRDRKIVSEFETVPLRIFNVSMDEVNHYCVYSCLNREEIPVEKMNFMDKDTKMLLLNHYKVENYYLLSFKIPLYWHICGNVKTVSMPVGMFILLSGNAHNCYNMFKALIRVCDYHGVTTCSEVHELIEDLSRTIKYILEDDKITFPIPAKQVLSEYSGECLCIHLFRRSVISSFSLFLFQ